MWTEWELATVKPGLFSKKRKLPPRMAGGPMSTHMVRLYQENKHPFFHVFTVGQHWRDLNGSEWTVGL